MGIVTPEMCKWGNYNVYEGPWWPGQWPYILPTSPDFWDKTLAVLSATEGGLDAVNMLDSCIVSTSMVQLCDAGFFLTTNLLGYLADKLGPTVVTGPLSEALKSSNATFKKFDSGWRFQFLDDRGVVKTPNSQRQLYLSCTGMKGSWNGDSRYHAKLWCSGLANIWNDERCRDLQVKYLKARLPTYISASAKRDLFDPSVPTTPWVEVSRAAYMSFSANNSVKSTTAYFKHARSCKCVKWSEEWTVGLLCELTFNPGIAIYADRYNRIRPVLEKLWGITLPKTAKDLPSRREMPTVPEVTVVPLPNPTPVDVVFEPKQIQSVEPTGLWGLLWSIILFITGLFGGKNRTV